MGNVWQITTQVSLHPAYRRGVFCIPRKGVHIYPRRNDVVNAHDIRYFRPFSSLFFRPVLRFSRSRPPLSLSHSSSFAFQRMEFDRLASPSSEFLVTRPTSFFVSSRVKWLLRRWDGNGFMGSSCFLRNLTAR